MKFYPSNNLEIDQMKDENYLKNIINFWDKNLNLVTCFDISRGKIYHTFMKADNVDFYSGILRVWKKDTVLKIISKLEPKLKKKNTSIYDKIEVLDRVFNRKGKTYGELSSKEKIDAYNTMFLNAKACFEAHDYIMCAYYLKSALFYKKTKEINIMLEECRKKVVNNTNKAA